MVSLCLTKNLHTLNKFHGDVRDLKSLLPLFEHIENKKVYVIHTAGIISMDEYITPLLYEVNVRGVRNVVSLCLQKHVYRFIYVSSVHALKQEDGIISETSYFHQSSLRVDMLRQRQKQLLSY